MSEDEKQFIKDHPLEANEIHNNASDAIEETARLFGNNFEGEKSDAFRHAYWNALNTIDVGKDLAKKYGDAHESKPDNPHHHKKMDLHNNMVGRLVASENPNATPEELSSLVMEELNNGTLLILDSDNNTVPSDTPIEP